MRKLAELSGESSKKISKELSEMVVNTRNIYDIVSKVQTISNNQANIMNEMSSALEKITESAQIMSDMAKVE